MILMTRMSKCAMESATWQATSSVPKKKEKERPQEFIPEITGYELLYTNFNFPGKHFLSPHVTYTSLHELACQIFPLFQTRIGTRSNFKTIILFSGNLNWVNSISI